MSMTADSLTTDTPAAPPATPAASPPPVSPATPGLDPAVYCPEDGKTWKSKFHGESGRRQQIETRLDQLTGRMEQQVTDLKGTGTEKDATIARLTAELAALQQTADSVPALQTQIVDLSKQAERAARLGILMQYPDLLAYQVAETRQPDDGGDPVEVVVRPFLDLIESTTLDGPALEQSLARLATALNVQRQALEAPPPAPEAVLPGQANPIAPGTPPAPTPADGAESSSSWRKQAMEWHSLAILGHAGPNGEDAKAKEAECWDLMRQAVQREQAQA